MSTTDISPTVTPSLQRKTLAFSGYKSQRVYCTKRGKKDDIERGRKKNQGQKHRRKRTR
jgi:hypothetical protein